MTTSAIVIAILISVLATFSAAAKMEVDSMKMKHTVDSMLKKAFAGVTMRPVKSTLESPFRNATLKEDYSEWFTTNMYSPDCSGEKAVQSNIALGVCVEGSVYKVEDDQKQTLSIYFYDNPSCTGTPTKGEAPLSGECFSPGTALVYSEGKPWESFSPSGSLTLEMSPDSCSTPATWVFAYALDVCYAAQIITSCSNGLGDAQLYANADCSGSYTDVKFGGADCAVVPDFYLTNLCS